MQLHKQADLGARGGEAQFENSFSNLAYASLRERAPQALEYVIGFQILERNQKDTRAAGIFGFEAGDRVFYSPAFFIDGDIKGSEIIFLPDQNLVLPLKDNWLNDLLRRKPFSMGQPEDKATAYRGLTTPNLLMGRARKYAQVMEQFPWIRDDRFVPGILFLAKLAKTTLPQVEALLAKKASLDLGFNLKNFLLATGPKCAHEVLEWCHRQPAYAEKLAELHGDDIFEKIAAHAIQKYSEPQPTPAVEPDLFDCIPKTAKKLEIFEYVEGKKPDPKLTTEQRAKLIWDKVLVVDNRPASETKVPYRLQNDNPLFNPDFAGIYDILVAPEETRKMVVLPGPMTLSGKINRALVIDIEKKGKGAVGEYKVWFTPPQEIWATEKYPDQEYRDWVDKLGTTNTKKLTHGDSGLHGEHFVFISPNGNEATVPLAIKETGAPAFGFRKGLYEICEYVPLDVLMTKSRGTVDRRMGTDKYLWGPWVGANGAGCTLALTDGGQGLAQGRDGLEVPSSFKQISVSLPAEPLTLCDPVKFRTTFQSKLASLKIHRDGQEVVINGKLYGELAAKLALLQEYGLRKGAAWHLVDAATPIASQVWLKTAASPYPFPYEDSNMSGAPFPADRLGPDPFSGRQHAEYSYSESVPVPGGTDPRLPKQDIDQSNMLPHQLGAQLAASGNKEIFDAGSIHGLLNRVGAASEIETYLKDYIKAIDKLGRQLIIIYWHRDDLAERYGEQDLPDLEDTTRNNFESMGDMTLKLKEKSINPGIDGLLVDLDESTDN